MVAIKFDSRKLERNCTPEFPPPAIHPSLSLYFGRHDHQFKYYPPDASVDSYKFSFYPRYVKIWNQLPLYQRRIQKGNFMEGQILQYPDKAKWAERLRAWSPGACLRAPVGSRGKAPGGGPGQHRDAPGF